MRMNFKFFLFIAFSTCLSASFQSSNDGGEILSSSADPSPTTIKKYKQVKEIIFDAFLANIVKYRKDPSRGFPSLVNKLTSSIFDIEVGEILKEMIDDDSIYFIVIYWLSIRNPCPVISFRSIFSICPLEFSSSVKEIESIKLVFDNFRFFIYKRFFKRNFCWTDPEAIKESYRLFHTLQIFWYNKLEPLGRKCLSPSEFAKERGLVEEGFRFINTFLTNDPKDQIIREYKRLRQYMLIGRDKAIPTIENFDLLVRYFVSQLESLLTTKFIEEFEWLASQSPSFLKCFFYFASWTQSKKGDYFTNSLFSGFKASTRNSISLEGNILFIFVRPIYNFSYAIRLARIITSKVEKQSE